jgi:hypothetical protein
LAIRRITVKVILSTLCIFVAFSLHAFCEHAAPKTLNELEVVYRQYHQDRDTNAVLKLHYWGDTAFPRLPAQEYCELDIEFYGTITEITFTNLSLEYQTSIKQGFSFNGRKLTPTFLPTHLMTVYLDSVPDEYYDDFEIPIGLVDGCWWFINFYSTPESSDENEGQQSGAAYPPQGVGSADP